MKSTYQLDSAQDLTPEIIEAIQKSYGNQPITITIVGHRQKKKLRNAVTKTKNQTIDTSLAESVIDMLFDQISKSKSKKQK